MKKTVLFGILLALAWSTGCGAEQGALSRSAAPDFTVSTLNGQKIQLSALKGKVILLDFWATWCPPCRAEIPHFNELYAAYHGKGLEIVGLALDQNGPADVVAFVQQQSVSYPIAMGTSAIVEAYGGVRGIPTTFLIDPQGRIAKKYVGYQEKQVFEKEIQALLAE